MDTRSGELPRVALHRPDRERAHRPLPSAVGDLDQSDLSAVRFKKGQLGETTFVLDERDPLVVGRPARVEGVVLEKCKFVGFSSGRRLDIKVVELVGRPSGG